MSKAKRYRAFISYSQTDKKQAMRLHRALEAYRVPTGISADNIDLATRKLGRFFRDDDEMGAATDLGAALEGAIADSEALIVVCSPHAAQSKWVNEEVLHFKRSGRADRIFAIIIDGQPNAERDGNECFPHALRFKVGDNGQLTDQPAEPLGIDLRTESYTRVCTRLVSGLLDVPFDDLWQRDKRRALSRNITFGSAASAATIALIVPIVAYFNPHYVRQTLDYSLPRILSFSGALEPGDGFQDCRKGTNSCPQMVVIPPGKFYVGSPKDEEGRRKNEDNEKGNGGEQVEVTIAQPFAVSRYEVTLAEWDVCVIDSQDRGLVVENMPDAEGCKPVDTNIVGRGEKPITMVSWNDANGYINWLSKRTGKTYRLLSESEWEYAARAGGDLKYSWGDENPVCQNDAKNGAVFRGCSESGTKPAKSFLPNEFGLHHMHGNVWEWLEDCYADSYAHVPKDGSPYLQEQCERHVVRGGAWTSQPRYLRSATRFGSTNWLQDNDVGFRVARDLPQD